LKALLQPEQVDRGNWIQAALDSAIGPVLAMLHESPAKPWTVAMLARQAHMAKSAFSERFRAAVGQPPLKYLTEYRVKLACQLLRGSDFGVKEIAKSVGYESASSFSNAFKRWVGVSPADYRRSGNGWNTRTTEILSAADITIDHTRLAGEPLGRGPADTSPNQESWGVAREG
jgi:AraC-like DNA-binding protein